MLPPGFAVLNGHNGTGKSTVLDAIDYALTGTINKFSVKGAKGGGLDEDTFGGLDLGRRRHITYP